MTLLPEIRGQLLNAVEARRPRRRRVPGGTLAVVASAVAGLAVAAVFVAVLHHRTAAIHPAGSPPGHPPTAWVNALGRAGQQVMRTDPACDAGSQPGRSLPLRVTYGRPDVRITSMFSTLARPATGPHRVTVRTLGRWVAADGIYIRYVWRGHADGITYYVVPARLVGAQRPRSARCVRDVLAAFARAVRALPSSRRAAAIAFARAEVDAPRDGVCIAYRGRGLGGQACESIADLKRIGAHYLGGSGGSDQVTVTPVLAPGYVAAVTALYPAQRQPGRVPHLFDVTKRPTHGVVVFVRRSAWDPPKLTFHATDGAVLWRGR